MALCTKCNGTGIHHCHRCGGNGHVAASEGGIHGGPAEAPPAQPVALNDQGEVACDDGQVRCPSCHGVGTETCRQCDGAGEI